MLRILTLEHFWADGPGKILSWIERRGHALRRVRLQDGDALPALEEFDVLIVMGGPMNIYEHEEHPWLVPEKAFILAAAKSGKPILGICLGGQLLADVLGGRVVRNREREIGWWPVRFTARPGPFASFPEVMTPFHWHGDTFHLPPGAIQVAESEACERQAYLVGDRLVGLQFHIEVGQIESQDLSNACPDDLRPGPYVQAAEGILAPPDSALLDPALDSLLDALAAKASPPTPLAAATPRG